MAIPTATPTLDSLNLPQSASAASHRSATRMPDMQIASGIGLWRKLLAHAEAVAPTLRTALIEGEQGSGKETLGRFLHARSRCARSAFQRHDAREWLAAGAASRPIEGFIYLDRVDLLSSTEAEPLLEIAKKLPYLPAGRVCLVASSQTPLWQLLSKGAKTPDLLARLSSVLFAIPPLRARREDIASLAHFLLERACVNCQQPKTVLAPGALARLMLYDWPGNVRELSAILESALLEARQGMIHVESLRIPAGDRAQTESAEADNRSGLDLHTVIRQHVRQVLNMNNGNKLRSSRQLGISRSTLYRILGNESVLGR